MVLGVFVVIQFCTFFGISGTEVIAGGTFGVPSNACFMSAHVLLQDFLEFFMIASELFGIFNLNLFFVARLFLIFHPSSHQN